MLMWAELTAAEPELAATGRDLLHQFGVGRADLLRDPRCALHAFPVPDNEDAFDATGVAAPRPDPDLPARLAHQYLAIERGMAEEPPGFGDEQLFELLLGTCLVTRTTGHGDWSPRHAVWRAP